MICILFIRIFRANIYATCVFTRKHKRTISLVSSRHILGSDFGRGCNDSVTSLWQTWIGFESRRFGNRTVV